MGIQATSEARPVHADEIWTRIQETMKSEIGEAAFQSWILPVVFREADNGIVCLSVPTRFMRDWVISNYLDRIYQLWVENDPDTHSVEVYVQADRPFPANPRPVVSEDVSLRSDLEPNDLPDDTAVNALEKFSAPLIDDFRFETFVVGKPNEFAHAAAKRVAETDTPSFNPLFLYGGVGLGKTHLMHAIAWRLKERDPSRKVLYMSAEKFMYRFIRALKEQKTVDFKDQFRSVDVLMIDDVQFIANKESTQEEFFHTFNALIDQGRQIVLSADQSPSDLEGIKERLKSRLNCGLVADIHATTFELRLGIVSAKAEQMGVALPAEVQEFLAHKITSNVRELEGALKRVVAHAELVGRELSLETAREILHDILRANERRVTIEEIQKQVASHFNVRVSDMYSARRARAVARPRQVAMYLAKQLTTRSLPEIGRKFGGRDHTTVMHAVRKVEELRDADISLAEDIDLLRRRLET